MRARAHDNMVERAGGGETSGRTQRQANHFLPLPRGRALLFSSGPLILRCSSLIPRRHDEGGGGDQAAPVDPARYTLARAHTHTDHIQLQ